jgi:hypothetical protein
LEFGVRFLLLFLVLALSCYTRPKIAVQQNAAQRPQDTTTASPYSRINGYILAEKENKNQRKNDSAMAVPNDTFEREKDRDNSLTSSKWHVSIVPHSAEAGKIDSLENVIEVLRSILYTSNDHLNKMKEYSVQNAIAYSKDLLKKRTMDTLEIENALKTLLKINGIEKEQLNVVLSIQEGNVRAVVNGYIRKKTEEMKIINEYLYSLSIKKMHDNLDIGKHDSLNTGK